MNRAADRVMIARVSGRPALIISATLAAAALACGSSDPPASCPRDIPASCPAPAPSFSAEVQAIFQAKCVPCHAPGGQEATKPYTSLELIQRQPLSTMLGQVYNCAMPPATAPQLTADERQALLGWLVCMRPDN
jgi:uncharacterized membrane protein